MLTTIENPTAAPEAGDGARGCFEPALPLTDVEINKAVREHAVAADEWVYQGGAGVLHEWAERFTVEFKLAISTPALQFDKLRCTTLGQYRYGRNGLGLRHEVTINTIHLSRSLAEVLATLLHELLHQWQERWGTPGKCNYHNREFRNKAAQYGIIVDKRGCHERIVHGSFTALLDTYNVDCADILRITHPGESATPRGTSKLKKWSCGCTNIRAAVAVSAVCLKCNNRFEQAES